jgi:hypothetical protein
MPGWCLRGDASIGSSEDIGDGRMRMKARIMFIRRSTAESNGDTHCEELEREGPIHVAHIGDRLFWNSRDYTVTEVTWDIEEDIVTVGAES